MVGNCFGFSPGNKPRVIGDILKLMDDPNAVLELNPYSVKTSVQSHLHIRRFMSDGDWDLIRKCASLPVMDYESHYDVLNLYHRLEAQIDSSVTLPTVANLNNRRGQ
jgi:hypothetical protein